MTDPNEPQKRVAFYLRNLHTGGIQRVVLTLANGLAARGYKVDIVLANNKGELAREVSCSVHVHTLGARRVLTSIPAFVRYMGRYRPDVVVSAPDSINLVLPWLKRFGLLNARAVVTVHNNMSRYAQNEGVWYSNLLPHFIARSYPLADQIVTVSEGIAHDLFDMSDALRRKSAVIYNPIVDQALQDKMQARVDHPWLQDEGKDIILGVGRFTPQKNFPLLLRAFAKIRRATGAKLILLGNGPGRSELQALARELDIEDHVDMPGFVSNPYVYYSRASLFVLSSIYEGFGNVLVEAMACGCPVVSTDCPSGPHEILEGGRWGRLVPVHDADALADAMQATLVSPPEPARLQQRADDFNVTAAVDKYIGVLFPRVEMA